MSVLENNLKAFFNRYPSEKKRLEPILRKPVSKIPELKDIEVPSTPSKPPIRIILLRGIANPLFIAKLLNDSTVKVECFKLFIFENNPEFLAFCFQQADLTQLINYPKTEWFLLEDENSVKSTLLKVLNNEAITSMMLNVQVLDVATPATEEITAFYAKIPQIYNEVGFHVFHNHGNLEDSLLGLEVTLKNKDKLLHCPGIKDLKDHYEDCTALVVGAGPSLDKNLETIKKYQDRFVIIAADAALKPLLKAGIKVNYTVSIERFNDYQRPFFEGLQNLTTDLVAFPVVHPDLLSIYPGKVRIVYRNYSFFAYFEKMLPKGILRSGGSASHLGLRLAEFMGCRKILMLGLDSAYEEKDGLYRSHCSDTGYPEWGEFIPLEDFHTKRRHNPPMQTTNNEGKVAMTNITYAQWIKELSEELLRIGQTVSLVNCSQLGLPMIGIPYVPLEKIAERLDPIVIEQPEAPEADMARAWDHKTLRKNLQSWKELCEAASQEADEILKHKEIDQARFEALMYVHAARLVIDDMFVAFVIQCCARDFFILENEWFSYRLGHGADQGEKTVVLKKRSDLFLKALNWLIKIVESEGNSGIKVHQPGNAQLPTSTSGLNNAAAS